MNTTAIIPLEAGNYYHVYNRGNNSGLIFYSDRNYRYFLDKYQFYVGQYVQTLAYCLLPNHFHLLIRIRPVSTPGCLADLISDQFRKMFICYSMAINKQETRTGSLFQKNFRRKKITDNRYLMNAVHYINHNPERHGFSRGIHEYPWNSYQSFMHSHPSPLDREEVISLFHDPRQYAEFHQRKPVTKHQDRWIIEE